MTEGPHAVNAIPDHVKFVVRFRGENTDVVRDGVSWLKDIAKAARAEFDERTCGKPYESLNVLDAPPGGMMNENARSDYECCIHGAMEHFGIEPHG